MRGVLPLADAPVPRRLRRTLRANPFEIRCDGDFEQLIRACAAPREEPPRDLDQSGDLPGLLRAAPPGLRAQRRSVARRKIGRRSLRAGARRRLLRREHVLRRETDASKVALVHLVARLIGGFVLLDVQFVTEHLRQFGAIELPPATLYLQRLDEALRVPRASIATLGDALVLALGSC